MRRDPNASQPTSVNFLPEWYRRRRRGWQLLRCQVLALVALLLLVGWLVGQQVHHRTELTQQHERVRTQLESVWAQGEGPEELRETHRELVQSLRVQHQLHRPVGYAEIAATLVDLVPEAVSLRRLRMEVGERTVRTAQNQSGEGDNDSGRNDDASEPRTRSIVTIQIEGIGPSDGDVSRFTGALASNPLFGDVEIGYWRQAEYDGLRARRFAVRTRVRLDRRYEPPAEAAADDEKPTEMTDAR